MQSEPVQTLAEPVQLQQEPYIVERYSVTFALVHSQILVWLKNNLQAYVPWTFLFSQGDRRVAHTFVFPGRPSRSPSSIHEWTLRPRSRPTLTTSFTCCSRSKIGSI